MAKFKVGDEVVLRAVVTRAAADYVTVELRGFEQSKITLRESYVAKAPATNAKKRGTEGVLTRQ